MAEPTNDEIETQRILVVRLGELGFVLPGSVVSRHTRCGNHRCHCYGEPPQLHGPYVQWTHTVANKTVSRIWSDEQLSRYQGWLDNARRARDTLSELEELAVSIVDRDSQERPAQARRRARETQPRNST